MLKVLSAVMVITVASILIYAATLPDDFRIERTVRMNVSAARIFPEINDLRRSGVWSPWEKMDPAMKRGFSGPSQGVGAVYIWDGNKEVGAGRIEIVESIAPTKVTTQLDFFKPMKARNKGEFILTPQGSVTDVTWAMSGKSPYLSKVFCMFMNMDKMVGSQFETGLNNLKAIVEKK